MFLKDFIDLIRHGPLINQTKEATERRVAKPARRAVAFWQATYIMRPSCCALVDPLAMVHCSSQSARAGKSAQTTLSSSARSPLAYSHPPSKSKTCDKSLQLSRLPAEFINSALPSVSGSVWQERSLAPTEISLSQTEFMALSAGIAGLLDLTRYSTQH